MDHRTDRLRGHRDALEIALADWPCVKLNPERAQRFAQATGTLIKTDRIDCPAACPHACRTSTIG